MASTDEAAAVPVLVQNDELSSRLDLDDLESGEHDSSSSSDDAIGERRQLALPAPGAAIDIPAGGRSNDDYIDITDLLSGTQKGASEKLNFSMSTLSKRWLEAAPHRKWPYRTLLKLDKEILFTLHEIGTEDAGDQWTPQAERKLKKLLAARQELLRPVFIRRY